ncbi:MAG: hypothetical protein Q8Q40_03950 [Methylococcaceae bacterium]|nr:hypothetical protein [Methylococcaceae bacterium]MDP3903111.1 hypothetical protein [Methylococcaceae bacterium]
MTAIIERYSGFHQLMLTVDGKAVGNYSVINLIEAMRLLCRVDKQRASTVFAGCASAYPAYA